MRPASEIHSALDLVSAEFERLSENAGPEQVMSLNNLSVARDVLSWVAGGDVDFDGINAWLCAFLLDDPPQIGPPPGDN